MNFSVHLILRASYTPVAAGFAIFFAAISFDPCGNELTVRAHALDREASSKPSWKYREYSTDLVTTQAISGGHIGFSRSWVEGVRL